MKIGIFTDTYFPQVNGVTFTVALWKEKLEARGHEVYIYYPGAGRYTPGTGEYPFRSFQFKYYKDMRIAVPTGIEKKARGLDIVHIHGLFSMAMAGLQVSSKLRIPRMLTYHTPADEYMDYITRQKQVKKTLLGIYNLWEKTLLNSCRIVTCPSNVIRDRLLSKGVKDATVLSNGVDLEHFKPVDASEFKTRYGLGAGRIIGFCGRFGYEKHLEDLIGIADSFDGRIILAGKGPAEDHYRKLAEGKKNVQFLGFLSRKELLEFYSSLDVFVFPSTAETQGLVALESMACGVPIVGANALALKDTIENGITGYLYECGDKKDLMEKIEIVYKNRQFLSMSALEHVKEHSVERSVDRLVEMYASLIEPSADG
jgi:1,2-diacylglycerol 3-alpha-glucosyltransferase